MLYKVLNIYVGHQWRDVMNAYDMIETKQEVMPGKPVIKETRIPVDLIVKKLGEGASFEDLLDGYPNLSRDAIRQACVPQLFMFIKRGLNLPLLLYIKSRSQYSEGVG